MPLQNFGIVRPGALFRCAQPDADGFRDLVALGVTELVKLNTDDEYPLQRERVEFGSDVTPFALSIFSPEADAVCALVARIQARIAAGAVVAVHCSHGRDRTGVVIGAWRLLVDCWPLMVVERERETYGVAGIVRLADHELTECLQAIAAHAVHARVADAAAAVDAPIETQR